MTQSVLLAYHPSDTVTMQQLRNLLQDRDFSVRAFSLTSTHLQLETQYDAVVVLCSDAANQCSTLIHLVETAQSADINLHYVLVRDDIKTALPEGAKGTAWVDIRDKRAVQASLAHLLEQLQSTQREAQTASLLPNPMLIVGAGILIIVAVMVGIMFAIAPALN